MMDSTNTRRSFRYQMRTPVFIAMPGSPQVMVPGLVSKLSRTGMELYAGINLAPGERLVVEFRTEDKTILVAGIICNRSGFCFGLEFCGIHIERGKSN